MSEKPKRAPVWEDCEPAQTNGEMLEYLFMAAVDRLVWDKHDAELEAINNKLAAALKDQPKALTLLRELEDIHFHMPFETAMVLAALAPRLACKPLIPETLLRDAMGLLIEWVPERVAKALDYETLLSNAIQEAGLET